MKKPWGDQLLVWQEWIQKRNAKDQEVAFIARGYDEAMDPRCGGDHGIFDQMVCLAAHASRGRPSPRRLPRHLRQRVLHLARTRYLGFNDHHLAEKLQAVEGFSVSRETLRRLLRQAGMGSPRKRRAPAHRQRRLRSPREGELVQLDGSPHD